MITERLQAIIAQYGNDPLKILKELNGYYECPKDHRGNRKGPLVGYAGKYPVELSNPEGEQLQYVGEIYLNFAKAEEHPLILSHFAKTLWNQIGYKPESHAPLVIVGPQLGGIGIGTFLAYHATKSGFDVRFACAEKKVTLAATEKQPREDSILQFARHDLNPGENVVIAEDVLNNFSTTRQLIELIEKHGGKVIAIAGLLNRSTTIGDWFTTTTNTQEDIPVFSLVRKIIKQWKQEDLAVIEDITHGNVAFKPKNVWPTLMQVMEDAEKVTAPN